MVLKEIGGGFFLAGTFQAAPPTQALVMSYVICVVGRGSRRRALCSRKNAAASAATYPVPRMLRAYESAFRPVRKHLPFSVTFF